MRWLSFMSFSLQDDAAPRLRLESADEPPLFARLLARKPRAMLIEEPTASLHPGAVGDVLSVIRERCGRGK